MNEAETLKKKVNAKGVRHAFCVLRSPRLRTSAWRTQQENVNMMNKARQPLGCRQCVAVKTSKGAKACIRSIQSLSSAPEARKTNG